VGGVGGSGGGSEAVFEDPDGRRIRVLHAFRRVPVVSVTLGCADVPAAAAAYSSVLGFRVVTDADELREARLPRPASYPSSSSTAAAARGARGPAQAPAVLALGPVHNTTLLVLEPRRATPAGAGSGGSSGSSGGDGDALPEPVVTVVVPDVEAAYARVAAAGWAASPYARGAAGFTAMDADGNLLYVGPA
jgi:catechol 2,3-dioxygenase-like lactoylglutathione lyase family enzyme